MIVAGIFVFWLATYFLDFWTHHGESVVVPDVKGMHYDNARAKLESEGFEVVLQDSVYEDGVAPGIIVDQNPKDSTGVKAGRTIYVTINAFYPRTVMLPVLVDISVRQARATLVGLDLKNIEIKEVQSEYKDLVYGVYCDGKRATPGMRVPLTAKICLEVGAGLPEESMPVDTLRSSLDGDVSDPGAMTAPAHSEPIEPSPVSNADNDPEFFD